MCIKLGVVWLTFINICLCKFFGIDMPDDDLSTD